MVCLKWAYRMPKQDSMWKERKVDTYEKAVFRKKSTRIPSASPRI